MAEKTVHLKKGEPVTLDGAKVEKLVLDKGVGKFTVEFNVTHVAEHNATLNDIYESLNRQIDIEILPYKESVREDGFTIETCISSKLAVDSGKGKFFVEFSVEHAISQEISPTHIYYLLDKMADVIITPYHEVKEDPNQTDLLNKE